MNQHCDQNQRHQRDDVNQVCKIRRQHSAEEKTGVVFEGVNGEDGIAMASTQRKQTVLRQRQLWNVQVFRGRAFSYPPCGIVVRPVAWAEPAAEIT